MYSVYYAPRYATKLLSSAMPTQGPVAPPAVGGAGNNVTDADVRVGTQIMMGAINRRLQELSDIKLQKKKAN